MNLKKIDRNNLTKANLEKQINRNKFTQKKFTETN